MRSCSRLSQACHSDEIENAPIESRYCRKNAQSVFDAAMVTYCRPSSMKVCGTLVSCAPRLACQRILPVVASKAMKLPDGSPVKTRLPPVESTPGCWLEPHPR